MALIPTIPGLAVRAPSSPAEVLGARRLHARCYVDEGYVRADSLVNGLIEDPWVPFSEYVVAIDTEEDEIVGTARIIKPSVRGFPAFEFFPMLQSAEPIFQSLDPNRCSEISALATPRHGLQNMAISAAMTLLCRSNSKSDERLRGLRPQQGEWLFAALVALNPF